MPKIESELAPYWTTTDGELVKIYHGDVLETLKQLPSKSIHCSVTSPPYYGLRDYGTAEWDGGDSDCDHLKPGLPTDLKERGSSKLGGGVSTQNTAKLVNGYKDKCGKCGAKRIDRQLGSEKIPDCLGWAKGENCAEKDWGSACHVCRMVLVFRELRRVLRDDGVLWVNYGDTYSNSSDSGWHRQNYSRRKVEQSGEHKYVKSKEARGLPSGNLCGVPWKVAFALQADGWVLRSDVPWVKRSCMPESTTNRPAKSLEYVFMFVKRMNYFFDMEAIKPKSIDPESLEGRKSVRSDDKFAQNGGDKAATRGGFKNIPLGKAYPTRNFRNSDLWFQSVSAPHSLVGVGEEIVGLDVPSKGYEGAHFAVFGPDMIRPLILSSTSEKGCCAKCGSPWKRILETNYIPHGENAKSQRKTNGANNTRENKEVAGAIRPQEMTHGRATREDKTIGWRPSCECYGKIVKRKVKVKGQAINDGRVDGGIPNGWDVGRHTHSTTRYNTDGEHSDKEGQRQKAAQLASDEREETIEEYVSDLPLEDHPIVPCTVLDPFLGSGTTCCVAIAHGRRSVGIELSEVYIKENAIVRVTGALMDRPQLAALAGRKIEKIKSKGSLLK